MYPVSMLDHEDREWSRKFGESYLEYDHAEDYLDDDEIERMEEEFDRDPENPASRRSAYGTLERIHDVPNSPGTSRSSGTP